MRIRQVVLAARDLASVVGDLSAVLGIEVAFSDPGVAVFGLENAVLPVGDTFLEVVSPVASDAAAARWLDRLGSDGGYMVIIQSDDADADRAHLARLGVRTVWSIDLPDIRATHLHPRDVGGAILSLDTATPPESWPWAGPAWRTHVRTDVVSTIAAVEIEAPDAEGLARRWAEVLDRPFEAKASGWDLALDQGAIRFVAGAREGVKGIDVVAANRGRVLDAASARGLSCAADSVEIGGTVIRLV